MLYSFSDAADGCNPNPPFLIDQNGALYGANGSGGSGGQGTVFQLVPPASPGASWTENTLYSFAGGNDGSFPSTLAFGPNGTLFGTTGSGGGPGCNLACGIAFQLTPPASGGAWTETVLYRFGVGNDTSNPEWSLHFTKRGTLYGVGRSGGNGYGTVFELSPPAVPGRGWTEKLLYSFTNHRDGEDPLGFSVAEDGTIYGATQGGAKSGGTLFSLAPPSAAGQPWSFSTIYSFDRHQADGLPWTPIHFGSHDSLIGVTSAGGADGAGTLYKLLPPSVTGGGWTYRRLHDFTGGADGGQPAMSLARHGRDFYGVASTGGSCSAVSKGCGTIFEFAP